MTLSRAGILTLIALGVMAANVAFTFLYMVLYGHVIDPGHEQAYYEAHAQIAAPYCSIVAGMPIMFFVGWWLGIRESLIVWLLYTVIDLGIVIALGHAGKLGVLVAASVLTKLGAAWLGALFAQR